MTRRVAWSLTIALGIGAVYFAREAEASKSASRACGVVRTEVAMALPPASDVERSGLDDRAGAVRVNDGERHGAEVLPRPVDDPMVAQDDHLELVRLSVRIRKLFVEKPETGWMTMEDVPALAAFFDEWSLRIRAARLDVQRAAYEPHRRRIDHRQCQEVAVEREGDESPVHRLQQPEHPDQVVMVGRVCDPVTRIPTYRVSRFEPGDDPGIDKAMMVLKGTREAAAFELQRIRGGR
jgi:hypothetical protein